MPVVGSDRDRLMISAARGKRWLCEGVEPRLLLNGTGAGSPTAPSAVSFNKLDGNLAGVYREYQIQLQSSSLRSPSAFVPTNVVADVQDGRVLVEAFADDGDGAALATQLQQLGGTQVASYGREADATVPIAALPQLAALASLRFARATGAMTMAGAVSDQGDTAQRSTNERTNLGYDGTGVKVGVLSDSYNNLGVAANDVTSGDLPAAGVQVLQDLSSGGTDEGRAMLQIVHDVAPGSSLAFATAFNGQASFASNITALKNAGAKIIVDDVIYFGEPMFQDGVIAQAVDGVVAGGSSYFSSAGNASNNGYASAWRTANTYAPGQIALDASAFSNAVPFAGGTSFDFDPGPGVDDMMSVSLPAGRTFTMALDWDSPNFSVSGGAGTPNDVDIYWMNPATGKVIFDITSNNVGGDAIETMRITAGSQTLNAALMFVSKSGGPLPSQIKFVTFNHNLTLSEYGYNAGSTYGHANSAGAQAVGATSWLTTPAYSTVGIAALESFSSLGGTPILFDTAGNRLATPQNRQHVDITAPDGGNTSGFSGSSGLNPFFGTSAAAPHAGAVAALMLQANPLLTTSQIYSDLQSTALDMDNPYTPGFDAGYDPASGFGLIQADAAVIAALPTGTAVPVAGYWTGLGNGTSWNDPLNWSANTIPTTSTDVFIDVATNPTINITGAASVRSIQSTEALDIASGGSLTYVAASLVGNVTLNNGGALNSPGTVPIITLTTLGNFNWVTGGQLNGAGRLTIASSGVLNVTGGGAHLSSQQLTLNGGSVQTAVGGNAVIVLPILNIGPSAFFNLADGTLIIDHSGADQSTQISGYVANGRHGGTWDGVSGINSSTAASTPNRTLGHGPAPTVFGSFPATFAGQTIDNLATLVRFTIAGDANLDRLVDVSDLGILATFWQTTGKTFTQGNFNYDSIVDVTDLGILATTWQTGLSAPPLSAPAASLAATSAPIRSTHVGSKRLIDDIEESAVPA
jgi:hypothetical protein